MTAAPNDSQDYRNPVIVHHENGTIPNYALLPLGNSSSATTSGASIQREFMAEHDASVMDSDISDISDISDSENEEMTMVNIATIKDTPVVDRQATSATDAVVTGMPAVSGVGAVIPQQDHHNATTAAIDGGNKPGVHRAVVTPEGVRIMYNPCVNSKNPYHTCSDYCVITYGTHPAFVSAAEQAAYQHAIHEWDDHTPQHLRTH